MKKHLLLLFAALLPLVASAHDFEVGGIYYNITSSTDRTVEVTFRGKLCWADDEYANSITLPTTVTYNGVKYRVTSIGENAFDGCDDLTSITIPASVTSIGIEAFAHCSNLTAIVVAEGNKVYDSRGGCNGIIETNSNTLIQGCATTIIPKSVTSIGKNAFYNCNSLTSITIPESVTSIGDSAFAYCESLTSINIPKSVISIGENAFEGCNNLKNLLL